MFSPKSVLKLCLKLLKASNEEKKNKCSKRRDFSCLPVLVLVEAEEAGNFRIFQGYADTHEMRVHAYACIYALVYAYVYDNYAR